METTTKLNSRASNARLIVMKTARRASTGQGCQTNGVGPSNRSDSCRGRSFPTMARQLTARHSRGRRGTQTTTSNRHLDVPHHTHCLEF